jgi:hypothetical protein
MFAPLADLRARFPRAFLMALLSLGAAAVASATAYFERGPDPVIFPPQQIPLYFLHNLHVRPANEEEGVMGVGLACTYCHENIEESQKATDRDIPGHEVCESCHAEWIGDDVEPAPPEGCAHCHRGLSRDQRKVIEPKLTIPDPQIKFPHAKHVAAQVSCAECHGNVAKKTLATRDDFPTMDRCVACHQARKVSVECTTCHLSLPSGKVATEYPNGRLKPNRMHSAAIHDADFLHDHAVPAQRDKSYCAKCHTDNDCMACHDGMARSEQYHPADWMAMHSLHARKDNFRCQSCHRTQTYCIDCHVRSGVATVMTPQQEVTRRTIRVEGGTAVGPHPMSADGWNDPTSRNFHGFQAQRNIRACTACHQEQYCLQCHSVGGPGGNPHGPNPERLKGSTAQLRNARACLKCHSPTDPSWR